MPELNSEEEEEDSVERFRNAGYRKEASMLKTENRKLKDSINALEAENKDLRSTLEEKFPRVIISRDIELRRELLITLHNVLEHSRAFGEVTPHFDFRSMGYNDHRTLHRSCNRFVEMGLLEKIRSNPSSFVITDSIKES